jgi:hypothetical protein
MSNSCVIGLRLKDGKVQPLAWTERRLSIKELRRATKKFRHDVDVAEPCCMRWPRLYLSEMEMKRELPRYDV